MGGEDNKEVAPVAKRKPPSAGRGRKKGELNKTTAAMKTAIMHVYAALQDKTGKEHGHFIEWAEENSTDFYKIASKLIPVQLDHSGGVTIIAASSADERI